MLSIADLFNAMVWYGCFKLLVYQYRKGLSERWYSHKMFWAFNLFFLLVGIGYSYLQGLSSPYMLAQATIQSVINTFLIVFLVNTKERTKERPRPGKMITHDGIKEVLENGQSRTTSFASFANAGFLRLPQDAQPE